MSPDSHPLSDLLPSEHLFYQITSRIRQTLEVQEILDAAVTELRSFLGTDRVKIYQFHADGHGEVIAESIQVANLPSLLGLHFPADDIPVIARQAFVDARQRVIVNVATQQLQWDRLIDPSTGQWLDQDDCRYRVVDPCHADYLKAMGVQSSLVIPILHQQTLWGLLVSHHHAPHDFSASELQVAQFVADQVAVAIAQANLLAEARRQVRQESTINQVSLSLHRLPAIDLQTGLHKTIAALQCVGGRLYRRATETQPSLLYLQGFQPVLPPYSQDLLIEQHILWQEYFRPAAGDRLQIPAYPLKDLYAEPRLRVLAPAFRGTDIRGLLVVPLHYRQEFLGYLTLFRDGIDTETIWAGQFDPDQRQIQPRNSFAAWKEDRQRLAAVWTDEDVTLAIALANQFAIAIYEYDLVRQTQIENQYRQQVELTLRRQAEEDRLRVAILHRIRQSLNLNTILDTTVAEVRQFLQTDRVLIYQFKPDWSGHVVAESVSASNLSILGQTIYDPCFAGKKLYEPYQYGRISQFSNLHNCDFPPCYFDLLDRLQVKANLVVPILMERWDDSQAAIAPGSMQPQLWGLLIVHYCASGREWQAWEINFLQQLAVQVAIALNQAELYQQVQHLNVDLEEQVQRRTAELRQALAYEALLKRITDKVRDSLDENQIMQTAVEELANGLQVVCSDAALYDLEQRVTTVCYEHLKIEVPAAIGQSARMDDRYELYHLLLAGQHFQFCLLPGVASSIRQIGSDYAILACPMLDDQGVLGDIWLLKQSHECFDDLEVRLIQQVANQCAIALRQARLYNAAQLQVAELARLNRLKDDFLNTISHELRTPMSSIKQATQMLEMLFQERSVTHVADQQIGQYFHILNTECNREIHLINDLLELTRLDAGSEPLSLTAIDLPVWVPHIAEPFIAQTKEQRQQLQFDFPPALPPITTDLSYLERIVSELLTNACKYTPAEQIILVSCHLSNCDQFQLQVSNTGVEIAATERDRIFDKFYRIPNNDPWKHGGTGLGLALVKKMTEYLNGSISVETQPHQTTFVVTLPSLSPTCTGEWPCAVPDH